MLNNFIYVVVHELVAIYLNGYTLKNSNKVYCTSIQNSSVKQPLKYILRLCLPWASHFSVT